MRGCRRLTLPLEPPKKGETSFAQRFTTRPCVAFAHVRALFAMHISSYEVKFIGKDYVTPPLHMHCNQWTVLACNRSQPWSSLWSQLTHCDFHSICPQIRRCLNQVLSLNMSFSCCILYRHIHGRWDAVTLIPFNRGGRKGRIGTNSWEHCMGNKVVGISSTLQNNSYFCFGHLSHMFVCISYSWGAATQPRF